jgi:predicted nucleotidyltransferase
MWGQRMGIEEILGERREYILRVAAKHGARNVRVFGSVVRGEAKAGSDVDFLVDVGPVHSSWFPAGLILDLEDLLGRKVDVVTEESIYWLLRRRILKEAKPL